MEPSVMDPNVWKVFALMIATFGSLAGFCLLIIYAVKKLNE